MINDMNLMNSFAIHLVVFYSFTSSKLQHKISRRDAHVDCGKPVNYTSKGSDCTRNGHRFDDFKAKCKERPSGPRDVECAVDFNVTNFSYSVRVTWNSPLYAPNAVWGYEVRILEKCWQIIGVGKEDRQYTFHGLRFDAEDRVFVHSLPRLSRQMENNENCIAETPDECATYKKYAKQLTKHELPFKCRTVNYVRITKNCVVGSNNSALVTVGVPMLLKFDEILIQLKLPNQHVKDFIIERSKIRSTTTQKVDLKYKHEYTVVVEMQRKEKEGYVSSRPLSQNLRCIKPVAVKWVQLNSNTSEIVYYLVAVFSCILIIAVVVMLILRRRLRDKLRRPLRNSADDTITNLNLEENASLAPVEPVVMIVCSQGCTELKRFVLLFASLLNSKGINVNLDILNEESVLNTGGRMNYFVKLEKEADHVVIVCTDNTDKYFNLIIDIVMNKILNEACRARYIPIYLSRNEIEVVPSCLLGSAFRIQEKIEEIILRIHHVRPYELNDGLVMNSVTINPEMLKSLKDATTRYLSGEHKECDYLSCPKGPMPNLEYSCSGSQSSFKSNFSSHLQKKNINDEANDEANSDNSVCSFDSESDSDDK